MNYDFDEAFHKTIFLLSKEKNNVSPRGEKTKELINHTIKIKNPELSILTNKHRKTSAKYLQAEINWYLSGELKIDKIKNYASMWEKIKNPDNTVNSNYGYFTFYQSIKYNKNIINQFKFCLIKLLKDLETRQAVINFNQPFHKYKNNKDFVCTLSQQFLIRNNKLHSIVNMRSCDIIYGATYDIPWFCLVQKLMLNKIKEKHKNIKIGNFYHNSASLHIYEKHFNMMEQIIKNNKSKSKNINELIKTNKKQIEKIVK